MNYYNYFTEIEDVFIRRRGKTLLLSPVDWVLIESWKERGVPLHVALRGIERAFDSYESRPRQRSVKTLLYCQEEVEAQFAEWLESQHGAGPAMTNGEGGGTPEREAGLPFPRTLILEHLAKCRADFTRAHDGRRTTNADELCDALARAAGRLAELEQDFAAAAKPDAERLEASLTQLEELLDRAMHASVSPQELGEARRTAEAEVKPYRERMERAAYEQTLGRLLAKSLRERYGVPRLSLFYL